MLWHKFYIIIIKPKQGLAKRTDFVYGDQDMNQTDFGIVIVLLLCFMTKCLQHCRQPLSYFVVCANVSMHTNASYDEKFQHVSVLGKISIAPRAPPGAARCSMNVLECNLIHVMLSSCSYRLEKLDLSSCLLTNDMIQILCPALRHTRNLK